MSHNQPLSGYLRRFGSRVRVKGYEYLGIVENDYEQIEVADRVPVSTNQPQVWLSRDDFERMSLVRNDVVELFDDWSGSFIPHVAKSIGAPRTDGFVVVGLIERS